MSVDIEAKRQELLGIMRSRRYTNSSQMAEAILQFVFDMHNIPEIRIDLIVYFLENFDFQKVREEEDVGPIVTGLSMKRAFEIGKESMSPFLDKLHELTKQSMPVSELAEWLIRELDEAEPRELKIVMLAGIIMNGFLPYKFLHGSTNIAVEEYNQICEENADTIGEMYEAVLSGKFIRVSDQGSFFDDMLRDKDPKTRAVLMGLLCYYFRQSSQSASLLMIGGMPPGINLSDLFGGQPPGMGPSGPSGDYPFKPPEDWTPDKDNE